MDGLDFLDGCLDLVEVLQRIDRKAPVKSPDNKLPALPSPMGMNFQGRYLVKGNLIHPGNRPDSNAVVVVFDKHPSERKDGTNKEVQKLQEKQAEQDVWKNPVIKGKTAQTGEIESAERADDKEKWHTIERGIAGMLETNRLVIRAFSLS